MALLVYLPAGPGTKFHVGLTLFVWKNSQRLSCNTSWTFKRFICTFLIHPKFALTRPALLKVKLQLQSQKAVSSREFKGPIDCAKQIIRVQGLGGLWSGFTGSLAFRSNFFWMFLSFEVCERGFLIGNLLTLLKRCSCGISPSWQGRRMRYTWSLQSSRYRIASLPK